MATAKGKRVAMTVAGDRVGSAQARGSARDGYVYVSPLVRTNPAGMTGAVGVAVYVDAARYASPVHAFSQRAKEKSAAPMAAVGSVGLASVARVSRVSVCWGRHGRHPLGLILPPASNDRTRQRATNRPGTMRSSTVRG